MASVIENKTAPYEESQEEGKTGTTVPDITRNANSSNIEATANVLYLGIRL